MHIIEFYFILFLLVLVSVDANCPHIGIGQYAFFYIKTPLKIAYIMGDYTS